MASLGSIGYMPLLRPGEHIISAAAFHYESAAVPARHPSLQAVFGSQAIRKSIVGSECLEVARRVFGDGALARKVLFENTMFGIVCRGLPDTIVESVSSSVEKPRDPRVRVQLRCLGSAIGRIASQQLRACNSCITEELEQRGYAAFKVLHQLASVTRCPKHSHPLHVEAERGKRSGMQAHLNLPAIADQSRLIRDGLPVSEGYASYLAGWQQAFDGQRPELKLDTWMSIIDRASLDVGGHASLVALIEATIEKRWDVRLDALTRALSIRSVSFVREEIALESSLRHLARRMVVADALVHAKLLPSLGQGELSLHMGATETKCDAPLREIRDVLLTRGASPSLIREMSAQNETQLGARTPTQRELRRIAPALPLDLLFRLRDSKTFNPGSWVHRTIEQRIDPSGSGSSNGQDMGSSRRKKVVKVLRPDDVSRFYDALQQLNAQTGGPRRLGDCTGKLQWPSRGIYFLMEPGEQRTRSGQGPRVVAAGAHALAQGTHRTLWNALSELTGNDSSRGGRHRRSPMRSIVGAALLAQANERLPTWGNKASPGSEVLELEAGLEARVSEYLSSMSVVWLPVDDEPGPTSFRGYLKRNAIALLSDEENPAWDPPSSQWLGHFLAVNHRRRSGLWNHQYARAKQDAEFIGVLSEWVNMASRRAQRS